MSSNIKIITWLVYFLIGVLFTFFVWIIPEWKMLRIRTKMISQSKSDDNIKRFVKSIHKYYYAKIYIKLLILSVIISIIVTLVQWVGMKDREVKGILDIFEMSLPLGMSYLFLSGINGNKENSQEQNENNKVILNLKKRIILLIVENEKQIFQKCIHNKLHKWYYNDKGAEFPALILRMTDDSFISILKEEFSIENDEKNLGAEKSILIEKPSSIIENYAMGDTSMNVYYEVYNLFDKFFEDNNFGIYKIISFICEHEGICKNYKKRYVMGQIKKFVERPSTSGSKIDEEVLNKMLI